MSAKTNSVIVTRCFQAEGLLQTRFEMRSAKAFHGVRLLRVVFVSCALNSFAILAGPVSQFSNRFE